LLTGAQSTSAPFIFARPEPFRPYLNRFCGFMNLKRSSGRHLELRAELARQDLRYRDLAQRVRGCGHHIEEGDIARIVAGRWDPPADVKKAIADIFRRPSFELFA
jgi:hypothetical protein